MGSSLEPQIPHFAFVSSRCFTVRFYNVSDQRWNTNLNLYWIPGTVPTITTFMTKDKYPENCHRTDHTSHSGKHHQRHISNAKHSTGAGANILGKPED